MSAEILVGTANWADHESFYPPELRGRRAVERLTFYARYFRFVEVDTTFYGIPRPQVVEGWVARTPADFRFSVKAFRSLTRHEREGGVPRPPTAEEERDFLDALRPLQEAGRLVAVHYQFPPWFKDTPDNRGILLEVRERHPDGIVAVEFRHRSWYDGGAWPRTEELLRELDATYVMVDAPQVGDATAPPQLSITSRRLSIVRFHGNNRRTWYIRDARTTGDRFDYLYRAGELQRWVPVITAAADAGVPVHVVMNNNRSNYAVANAFDMAALLDIRMPRPPQGVIDTVHARDRSIPSWVDASEPPPAAGGGGVDQLGLGLG
ncbi:MAG TPA: DUF72 domain-containing protein [Candidatus Dormibacteraeota bacterium]|nr:DUF72 domain-containing protein [Candidatus Dormibacteraeota bacterium]